MRASSFYKKGAPEFMHPLEIRVTRRDGGPVDLRMFWLKSLTIPTVSNGIPTMLGNITTWTQYPTSQNERTSSEGDGSVKSQRIGRALPIHYEWKRNP